MQSKTHSAFSDVMFLPGTTMERYLDDLSEHHPSLYDRLDIDRLHPQALARTFENLDRFGSPFDGKETGGRGDAYRNTQLANPLMRIQGISRLCEWATPPDAAPGPGTCLLDALGGNGTLSRAMRLLKGESAPTIFIGDIAAPMIANALAQGLPAVRQTCDRWLLKDGAVDGVIFAYGTHHIPGDERPQALSEAYRVLRPNGRVVVHDFEEGTPTARWYSEVIDRYTYTGHKYEHFTAEEMHALLVDAGFCDVRVRYLYDPCVVLRDTPEAALRDVLNYMISLFALAKLMPDGPDSDEDAWAVAEGVVRDYCTFSAEECARYGSAVGELTVEPRDGQFCAELPRIALVGTATRP